MICQNRPIYFFHCTKLQDYSLFVHVFVISTALHPPAPTSHLKRNLHEGRDLCVLFINVSSTCLASVWVNMGPDPQNTHNFAPHQGNVCSLFSLISASITLNSYHFLDTHTHTHTFYELICALPKIQYWSPDPQHIRIWLFGDRAFKEMIKLEWGH